MITQSNVFFFIQQLLFSAHPIPDAHPKPYNVHAYILKVQEGRNGPMSRTAGRAMRGWGSPMRGGEGPAVLSGRRPPRTAGNATQRATEDRRGPRCISAGCFHAHAMVRMALSRKRSR